MNTNSTSLPPTEVLSTFSFEEMYKFLQHNTGCFFNNQIDTVVELCVLKENDITYFQKRISQFAMDSLGTNDVEFTSLLEEFDDDLYGYYIDDPSKACKAHKRFLNSVLSLYETKAHVIFATCCEALALPDVAANT
jgi:hypothetical protein